MKYVSPVLFLLLVIIGVKLTDSIYQWLAFGPERRQIQVLRRELVDAGASIVRTREQSDSIRAVMRAEDAGLSREQQALRRYDAFARDGGLPPDLYEQYKDELDRYNDHVNSRNAKLTDWQEVLSQQHTAVVRYNVLADSIHDLATRMGDPYYAVPTPAEAAAERGIHVEPIRPEP